MDALKRGKGSLFILWVLLCICPVRAQEYKYEAGIATGIAFYLGDANPHRLFRHSRPAGGCQFRYNLNGRWAVKANWLMGTLAGRYQPGEEPVQFERTWMETGIQAEFNFCPYSDRFIYKNTCRLTPFVLAGAGWTFDLWSRRKLATPNLPLGAGIKYKIKNRINLVAELSFRKLFTDALDVTGEENSRLENPYEINSWIVKNKDWYVVCLISVTYDLGIRKTYCR
ncbi:MAG: DUF6089 family protein [Tannerellaceae bacterium]|nr:DUF6089 family protein [Tannerellaceae bacterium]